MATRNRTKKEDLEDGFSLPDDYDEVDNDELFGDGGSDFEEEKSAPKSNKRLKKTKKSRIKNKRRKVKEANVNQFFDEFADEDDDEEEDDVGGEINEEERQKIYERYDQNKFGQRSKNMYAEMSEDDLEDYAKNLESKYNRDVELDPEEDDEARNIYPTRADPTLWLVKCKQGCEREACVCLMNKYLHLKKQGKPLSIISATISDKVQSHLYIEAYKEVHVREAIRGLNLIFQRDCIRIKNEETASVFEIDKASKITLKKGQWVKLNSGLHSGDYAKVVGVDDSKDGCYLKLIPRIKTETGPDPRIVKNRKKIGMPERAPLKFFNKEEFSDVVEKYNGMFNKQMLYWNRNYYRKGFLYKYFNIKNIETDNVIPPRAILEKFLRPGENHDEVDHSDEDPEEEMEKWKKLASENILLTKGDKIKVISGELQNLTGKVIAIEKKVVTMKPDIEDIPDNLDLDISMISKHFEEGDHVYVVEGEYEGEKGMITKVKGGR